MPDTRLNWADHAKGLSIILIVLVATAAGQGDAGQAASWMGLLAAWLKPFLVPAFFLLAALFLNLSVFGSSKSFFDRKFLRLAYFYLMWMGIQAAVLHMAVLVRNPAEFAGLLLTSVIEPSNGLWLVYMLAVFHVVTRLVRFLPPFRVFLVAALLQAVMSTGLIDTGWSVSNLFAEWYVFFFAGYAAAPHVFEFANRISGSAKATWNVLGGWAVVNAAFVALNIAQLPFISLVLGFAGALAIIATSVQLSRMQWANPMEYAGRHHLIIYLTFFIPMTLLQRSFAGSGLAMDAGTACLVIALVSVILPLVFHRLVVKTPLAVLYKRPRKWRLQPAHGLGSAGLLSEPSSHTNNA